MNEIVERVRAKYPQYGDLTDEQLTLAVGQKYPTYLDGSFPKFEQQFKLVDAQRSAAERGDVGTYEFMAHPDDPPKEYSGNASTQGGLGIMQGIAQLGEQAATVAADTMDYNPIVQLGADMAQAIGGKPRQQTLTQAREAAQDMADEAGYQSQSLGDLRRETGGPEFVGDLAAGAASLAPTVAVSPGGFPAMVVAAGLQSYGATRAEAADAYAKQGLDPAGARQLAQRDALESGFATALVTAGFGKTGAEAFGKLGAPKAIAARFGQFIREAGLEATEEAADQALQSILAKAGHRPDLTLAQAATETATAGGIGGVIGGVANVPRLVTNPEKTLSELTNDDLIAKGNAALQTALENLRKLEELRRPSPTVEDGQLAQPIVGEFIEPPSAEATPLVTSEKSTATITGSNGEAMAPEMPAVPNPARPAAPVAPLSDLNTFPLPESALSALDQVIAQSRLGGDPESGLADVTTVPTEPTPVDTAIATGERAAVKETQALDSSKNATAVETSTESQPSDSVEPVSSAGDVDRIDKLRQKLKGAEQRWQVEKDGAKPIRQGIDALASKIFPKKKPQWGPPQYKKSAKSRDVNDYEELQYRLRAYDARAEKIIREEINPLKRELEQAQLAQKSADQSLSPLKRAVSRKWLLKDQGASEADIDQAQREINTIVDPIIRAMIPDVTPSELGNLRVAMERHADKTEMAQFADAFRMDPELMVHLGRKQELQNYRANAFAGGLTFADDAPLKKYTELVSPSSGTPAVADIEAMKKVIDEQAAKSLAQKKQRQQEWKEEQEQAQSARSKEVLEALQTGVKPETAIQGSEIPAGPVDLKVGKYKPPGRAIDPLSALKKIVDETREPVQYAYVNRDNGEIVATNGRSLVLGEYDGPLETGSYRVKTKKAHVHGEPASATVGQFPNYQEILRRALKEAGLGGEVVLTEEMAAKIKHAAQVSKFIKPEVERLNVVFRLADHDVVLNPELLLDVVEALYRLGGKRITAKFAKDFRSPIVLQTDVKATRAVMMGIRTADENNRAGGAYVELAQVEDPSPTRREFRRREARKAKAAADSNTPKTLNRATLPRRIDDATPLPDAGGGIHAQQIREYLQTALDVPFRTGTGAGRTGFFRTQAEVIRTKEGLLNSLTVATHEVGHYLHGLLLGNADLRSYDPELLRLGAPGTGNSSATPSSTVDYIRGEGIAEYMRLRLTDPAAASQAAPRFEAFINQEMAANHPVIADILDHTQQMVADYINQPIAAELRGLINWRPRGKRKGWRQWFAGQYADWFNELAPLERAEQRLIGLGLPADVARRASQAATNYLGGWVGKAEYSLWKRQIDATGRDVGHSLNNILKRVPDIDEFAMWTTGQRILELASRGKQAGINPAKLKELREWVVARRSQYQKHWRRLDKFLENELQMAVQAGFITRAEAARIKAKNEFYVPFMRDPETLGTRGRGRGFIDVAKPLRRFVGTDGRIYNPLESIIKNVYHLRNAVERNRVGRLFIEGVEQTQGGGRIADPIARKLRPDDIEVPADVLDKWLADNEFENIHGVEAKDLIADNPLAFRLWRLAQQQSDASQGIFQVWRDGRRERWQLDDQDLFRALQLSDATEMALFNKIPLGGMLNWMTRMLRSGATMTLEFIARNAFVRDPFTAAVYSQHGYVPFYDTAKGIFHALGRTEAYWDFVKAGGRYADLVASDRRDLRAKLAEVAGTETALDMVRKWGNPIATLQKLTESMELASRIAEFNRAKAAGASDVAAANAAKDVTLNFSQGGFKGRVLNRLIPFFNAQLLDIDKLIREHDPRNLRRASAVAAKGFLYVTIPSLLTWWMGKDDEDIQALPEWRKNFFWNLKFDGQVWSFPKPFLLGQLYGTSAERALDYLNDKDPNALRKWFMETLRMGNPIPLLNPQVMPAGVKPMLEGAMNYSLFRGAPLEGQADQKLPKQFRMTPDTSEAAKYVSRLAADVLGDEELTVSPIVIDNTIRGTLGGLGRYGTAALDFMAAKSGLADLPPAPSKDWTELPGIKAFANSPYAASQDVQRFYEGLRRAEQTVNTLRDLQTIMDDGAPKYWRQNSEKLQWYEAGKLQQARQFSESMSGINKTMVAIRQSRSHTGEEKSKILRELAAERNRVAKQALQTLHPQDLQRVY